MKKGLSIRGYRAIDIGIFSVILFLIEFFATYFTNNIFTIFLLIPIVLIVLMRWGLYASITVVIGSVAYVYAISLHSDGITYKNYLAYILGNLFILINILWFIKGKEKVKKNLFISIGYVVSAFLLIEVGKTIFSDIFLGGDFFRILIGFLGSDALNVVIGLVIILIARLQNGIFEDQIAYIKRIKEETEGESNEIPT
ncbi:MAG: hypothetical protein J6W25_00885 [Bacilli bacterium]|nr:hypothetical protein [Bacilli bacterium]